MQGFTKLLTTSCLLALSVVAYAEEEPTREELLFENGELLRENSKKLSNIFGRKNQLRLAIERLDRLLEDYPESPYLGEAAYLIGDSYYQLRDYESAVDYFLKCCELAPDTDRDALYRAAEATDLKLKNQRKAAELYEKVLQQSPSEKNREKALKRLEKLRKLGFGLGPQPAEQPRGTATEPRSTGSSRGAATSENPE